MRTVDGSVPIEQLKPGDYLLSRNEQDPEGPVSARQVEEVFVRQGYVLDLRVEGQLIRTTEEHPFYRAGDGWVAAWELCPGDQLVGQGGQLLEVESVTQTGIVETVYNVRVADWHTYFVGCDEWGFSVWAHNVCRSLPGASASSSTQGMLYAYLAKQILVDAIPGYARASTTVAVTEVTAGAGLRYVVAVYSSALNNLTSQDRVGDRIRTDYRAVEVHFRVAGEHAEQLLHQLYRSEPGFTGVIGHSNKDGTCPTCQAYFATAGFANVWWDDERVN